ncbi:MAG: TraB/GumN family protein [Gammaproteobacteria bacterium]|nr:TraB/GumN family protein [Gammaproteobacteria bacterium]MDX5375571.1 TraB/GumN family protein [Gammaproteobacteria bacterium]
MTDNTQPLTRLQVGDTEVVLLGTAHVSRESAEAVRTLLDQEAFDAVAVELCPSRQQALLDPDHLSRLDLFRVMREGRVPMVMASLALGAYQQRLADQFGIEPGAEMKAAIETARAQGRAVWLIDREIGTTLKRVYRNVPFWKRLGLIGGLIGSVMSKEKVEEADIERLKEGDILETTFSEFAEQAEALYLPLIDERDRYMAARLREDILAERPARVLAVVGAGHLKGIANYLAAGDDNPGATRRALEQLPPPSRWPRLIPWAIALLVVVGFAIGFRESRELGWQLIGDWVLINGGLAGLGALLARGHPLTVLSAALGAPLTSLNPAIGAGMVAAFVETWLRKPSMADFAELKYATTRLGGWWKNRVARILLVFFLTTLGSAAGTYLAGFRIFERLSGS